MKVLLTGANGYIGKRLLFALVRDGHQVVCAVRNRFTFHHPLSHHDQVEVVEADFQRYETLSAIPTDIQVAFYLIHSLSSSQNRFDLIEANMAYNFKQAIGKTRTRQVVYLGGIVNEDHLSPHLESRLNTEKILRTGKYKMTVYRAGIIIGSGSASFEIIRDLVEKLPVMIAPKWLNTPSQPIAVRNVIDILRKSVFNSKVFDKTYDIGGPDILTYKEMLLRFARRRKLKRWILTVPVLSPKLSAYWLYFVTATSYRLASNLVDSMSIPIVGRKNNLPQLLDIDLLSFEQALDRAFTRVKQNHIISSWKDSGATEAFGQRYEELVEVPEFGCLKDEKTIKVSNPEQAQANIWSLGGEQGWYFGNWLWKIRGYLDKLAGGVGLRRGRTDAYEINSGDTLDFWRVLVADKANRRLLLFAEMKLPGEAWLEFRIDQDHILHQTATFRPRGLAGRLYWLLVLPFHFFVFNGMIRGLATSKRTNY